VEWVYFVCGRHRPQLMRIPLGSRHLEVLVMRQPTVLLLLATALWPWSQLSDPLYTGRPQVADRGPLITQQDSSGFRLLLPVPMQKVLGDSAPDFVLWPWEHYDRDLRSSYVISHRTAPSAVIGDYNGDGVQDVVMEGHDRNRMLRLCLLSRHDGFTFIVLQSLPWDSTKLDPHTEISYLTFQGPGRIGTNYNEEEMVLRTDAFERITLDKAAVLYYWDGKAFVEFQTAD
jgi:hypothetical protein